jgi:glycosyltransferase involved in cell wall biosynthesis
MPAQRDRFRSRRAAVMQSEAIKLLEFVTCFNIGGTERQVTTLARGIDPCVFDLHLACLRRTGELLPEIARWAPSEFKLASLWGPRAMREQFRFAGYVKHNDIQILHSYGFYANAFAVPPARLAGAPIIVASIRDNGDLLTPPQRLLQRTVCRLADCILANSESVRRRLMGEGYDPKKLALITNGIDLSRFPESGGGRLRRELGLDRGARMVAVISRLAPLKGVEHFLQAAAALAGRFPDVMFLIIGDGNCRKNLEEQVVRLGISGRVIFTGFRIDIPDVLRELAVSVLPSLSESLSNTLLESMAAGVPVVATRAGGNAEAVEDGVTGLLAPPADAPALARAIALLLENPAMARSFGEAGRRRVAERFSTQRMVRETEQLYLRLLQNRLRRNTRRRMGEK